MINDIQEEIQLSFNSEHPNRDAPSPTSVMKSNSERIP